MCIYVYIYICIKYKIITTIMIIVTYIYIYIYSHSIYIHICNYLFHLIIYIKAVLIYTHVSYKTHKQKKELSLSHTNAQNFKAHDDGGPTPDLSTSDRINSESVPSVSLAIFAVDHV